MRRQDAFRIWDFRIFYANEVDVRDVLYAAGLRRKLTCRPISRLGLLNVKDGTGQVRYKQSHFWHGD